MEWELALAPPTNYLLCPEKLRTKWWKPLQADGIRIQPTNSLCFGDPEKAMLSGIELCDMPLRQDLLNCRAITWNDIQTNVYVIDENGFVRPDSHGLLIDTYCHDSKVMDWLTRVLVASGARHLSGVFGKRCCKGLFVSHESSPSDLRSKLEFVGRLYDLINVPEKLKLKLVHRGHSVKLFGGSCYDCDCDKLGSYIALDYSEPWLFGKAVSDVVLGISEQLLSMGFRVVCLEHKNT